MKAQTKITRIPCARLASALRVCKDSERVEQGPNSLSLLN